MPVTGLLEKFVDIPDGVQVRVEGDAVIVAGHGHTLRRKLSHPRVEIAVKGKQATVRSEFPHRREAALVGTFAAHLRNMIVGVQDGFTYEMKIVYSHFPMKATVKGSEFVIENFLGEKFPRKTKILGDTKVEVEGDAVVLTGPDLEAVGQTAANIELATRIRGFDSRIFQDGIYITKKAGEALNG
jgi:large subunit ribosomal protein L6